MTRVQRYFLAIAILLLAWFFHVNTCDWHYKAAITYYSSVGLGGATLQSRFPIWIRFEQNPATGGGVSTGLTTEPWVGLGTALVWGVFVPLTMVTADIWWMLGWRRYRSLVKSAFGRGR
jgi:hypothetical protein